MLCRHQRAQEPARKREGEREREKEGATLVLASLTLSSHIGVLGCTWLYLVVHGCITDTDTWFYPPHLGQRPHAREYVWREREGDRERASERARERESEGGRERERDELTSLK